MKKYEKHTIIKFTLIYFLSTAFFVIILGHMASCAQRNLILQKHTIKMHQYLIKLKQHKFNYTQQYYHYKLCDKNTDSYELARKVNNVYQKAFPYQMGKGCVIVSVNSNIIDNELKKIQNTILSIQLVLLLFFLGLGYFLAKMSLKPIQENISHLDRFIKDLIHDLNTPISSIMLNLKILKKYDNDTISKPINRIDQSVHQITSLYDNLEVIIKKTLPKEKVDLYKIFEQKKGEIAFKYPKISFLIETREMVVMTNFISINRIIDNILSNSCKYSTVDNPLIQISFKNNKLIIKDNGKGMQYPQKIFERSYSENENGHGIGMHIVQRLCNELDIKINIDSIQEVGTTIKLVF